METELKVLLESVDKTMASAEKLRKKNLENDVFGCFGAL